ncbi:MAG: sulfite exporter TauE/SafE family protein [Chlamydiales bacterium]|nr:sulfite exporter TauE/SafE family protein [Chlamydiales bacterium]
MLIIEIVLYVLVGATAGFLAGLLGIGGGIVAIPCLFAIFRWLDISTDYLMQIVVATSLASMILNTLAALVSQQRRHNIDWNLSLKIIFGIVVGCFAGAKIALDIPSNFLKAIFGIFMCLLGAFLYIRSKKVSDKEPEIPSLLPTLLIGFANSFIATILGISGGILIVPILQSIHIPIKKAIGISSATSFVTALAGTIAFITFNQEVPNMHQHVGLIYLPAFICISLTTMVFAPLGVKVSHHLHSTKLKKIFGLVVFFAGLYMIIQI